MSHVSCLNIGAMYCYNWDSLGQCGGSRTEPPTLNETKPPFPKMRLNHRCLYGREKDADFEKEILKRSTNFHQNRFCDRSFSV